MKIIDRISYSFWAPIVFGMLAASYFLYQVISIHNDYSTLIDREVPIQSAVAELRFGVVRVVSSTAEYGFIVAELNAERMADAEHTHESDDSEEQELSESGTDQITESFGLLEELLVGHSDSDEHLPYIKEALSVLIELSDEIITSKQNGVSGHEILELKEMFEEAERAALTHIEALANHEADWFQKSLANSESKLTSLIYEVAVLMFLGVFLSNTVRLALTRTVHHPLNSLIEKVSRIRSGATYQEIHTTDGFREDEFGELSQSLDSLLEQNEKLLAQYREEKEHAEEASRSKSEFLANMSHELRTPMHAILSYSEMGAKKSGEPEEEKFNKYFTRIHGSASRLLGLLNDLLDLSKLEAQQMVFHFTQVDVLKLIEASSDELRSLLSANQLRLMISPSAQSTQVVGDGDRLHQVIVNLLSNAIKFSNEGDEIHADIRLSQVERAGYRQPVPALQVSIIDMGKGIPEDEVELIFDKFQQSSRTRSKAGGTGLGLAICREIISGHGGVIWAENNEEHGASFIFRIPIDQSHSASSE